MGGLAVDIDGDDEGLADISDEQLVVICVYITG